MSASLDERLGGRDGIAVVVNDIVEMHLVNPLIRARFEKLDAAGVANLKRHVVEFFCAGAGGPADYTGRDMVSAHRHMNINAAEMIAAIDDVAAAMAKHGAGERERGEVVAILYSLKDQVDARLIAAPGVPGSYSRSAPASQQPGRAVWMLAKRVRGSASARSSGPATSRPSATWPRS